MYRPEVRVEALALIDSGFTLRAVSVSTDVSRSTLREWRDHPGKDGQRASCPRCANNPALPEPRAQYAYLLGLYLGDGCISASGDPAKGVWKLRVMCCDASPGLIEECARAVRAVRPANKVMRVRKQGCTEVLSCSRHWPCLFPQHGLGQKHSRPIELQSWQQAITTEFPGQFAQGLFHSDGYRGTNRVHARLASGDRCYEYPRYLFTNESMDILRLCAQTLDQLGVAWRYSRRNAISVARREAVARLDQFVGAKY